MPVPIIQLALTYLLEQTDNIFIGANREGILQ